MYSGRKDLAVGKPYQSLHILPCHSHVNCNSLLAWPAFRPGAGGHVGLHGQSPGQPGCQRDHLPGQGGQLSPQASESTKDLLSSGKIFVFISVAAYHFVWFLTGDIVALQGCISFCYTTRESALCTHISPPSLRGGITPLGHHRGLS